MRRAYNGGILKGDEMYKAKWKKVEDSKVRHIWKCEQCGKEVMVDPTFYQDAGEPICEGNADCEGDIMTYQYTEVLQ